MLGRACLTTTVLLSTILASAAPASAADYGATPPPIVPFIEAVPAVGNLSGAYVGASLGYAFERDHGVVTTGTVGFLALPATAVPRELELEGENGLVAGLHAGANMAISNRFVVGGEVDVTFGQLEAKGESTGTTTVAGATLRTAAATDTTWLGTARARAGVMAFDDVHVYGTAGLAFGQVDVTTSVTDINAPAAMWEGSEEGLELGYALGAGAEYVLGPNVTLRADYLYYNLGEVAVSATGNGVVRANAALNGIDYETETTIDGHILRGGINLRLSSLF